MQKVTDTSLFPFWIEDWGLSWLLAFLVLVVIFVPMFTLSRFGQIGLGLMFALLLFSGAVASVRKKVLMYLIVALIVLEFTAEVVFEFNPTFFHAGWDTVLRISGLAILAIMTLRRTFRPGTVSMHRVMGGVAAYLLIGLTWAFGYKLLLQERPDAIHFQSSLGGSPAVNRAP